MHRAPTKTLRYYRRGTMHRAPTKALPYIKDKKNWIPAQKIAGMTRRGDRGNDKKGPPEADGN